jgi:hypothetical protein
MGSQAPALAQAVSASAQSRSVDFEIFVLFPVGNRRKKPPQFALFQQDHVIVKRGSQLAFNDLVRFKGLDRNATPAFAA